MKRGLFLGLVVLGCAVAQGAEPVRVIFDTYNIYKVSQINTF